MKEFLKISVWVVSIVLLVVTGFLGCGAGNDVSTSAPPAAPLAAGSPDWLALGKPLLLAACAEYHRTPETNTWTDQRTWVTPRLALATAPRLVLWRMTRQALVEAPASADSRMAALTGAAHPASHLFLAFKP